MSKAFHLTAALLTIAAGCASVGTEKPKPGPVVAETLCSFARAEAGRCDRGEDLDRTRCDAARAAVFVCSITSRPVAEQGLLASTLKPGVGLTPRSSQTCWRTFPGGPPKLGVGRLDVDPWTVAGIPGGGQGGLPCGRPEVNEAYRLAFGQPCIGEGAALGGYCGGPSNEILRGAPPKLEWACRHRPDLLGSSGPAEWNCSPGGLDLIRLAAHVGGVQMMAAIDAAMGNVPPPPPAPRCGDGRVDPGETCASCPVDVGACPPPPPPPDPRLDCRGLAIPPPAAPQFVGVKAGTDSTGLAGYQLVECRGGSLPTPEPERPAISTATRATLAALCGWIRSDQPARRRRCAAAVSEILGVDGLRAEEVTP